MPAKWQDTLLRMTKAQQARLEMYRAVREVCRSHRLALASLPVARRGFVDFESSLQALEQVLATAPGADSSPRQSADYREQVAAGFRSVECMLRERLDPHLPFFAAGAPQFYGAYRVARLLARKRS